MASQKSQAGERDSAEFRINALPSAAEDTAKVTQESPGLPKPLADRIFDNQEYRFRGFRPFTRRDGTGSYLAVWESNCTTCGAAFTFSASYHGRKFAPNRRCDLHKRPGVPVHRKRKRIADYTHTQPQPSSSHFGRVRHDERPFA